jgi:hypothetical protein
VLNADTGVMDFELIATRCPGVTDKRRCLFSSPHRTDSLLSATNIADVGAGKAFMKKWFGAAAIVVVPCPAFAGDVGVCTLGADKKTVTVTASNP